MSCLCSVFVVLGLVYSGQGSDPLPSPDFNRILEGLPEKPPRSRLGPYRELIFEMRRRGWTFREIAKVLGEKCGVRVVPSTIYDFVNGPQSKEWNRDQKIIDPSGERRLSQSNEGRAKGEDDVDSRIAALKARKTPPKSPTKRLRLVKSRDGKTEPL